MRAIVCGGRSWCCTDERQLFVINELNRIRPDSIVVGDNGDGAPNGVDAAAFKWAHIAGVPVAHCPALWDRHGKAAGPRRNAFMLTLGVDSVIAFPGGRGTKDMLRRAAVAGVGITLLEPRAAGEGGEKP